jgi:hypothetical protein
VNEIGFKRIKESRNAKEKRVIIEKEKLVG